MRSGFWICGFNFLLGSGYLVRLAVVTSSMFFVLFLICVYALNFVPNHDWPRGCLWFSLHFQLMGQDCYFLGYLTDMACLINDSMFIVLFLIWVHVLNFVPNHDWPRRGLWFSMHLQLMRVDCYLFGYLIDMACPCLVFGYSLWHMENWCSWCLDFSLNWHMFVQSILVIGLVELSCLLF